MMNPDYFCYKSFGVLQYEPQWLRLKCDDEIVNYYAWSLKKYGVAFYKGNKYGSHITIVRNEAFNYNKQYGEIEFHYAYTIRNDDGNHFWVDVWCPRLHEIRSELGLPPKMRQGFHLTIGRIA